MLHPDPSVPAVPAAEAYGAFQTTSAIEDTPTTSPSAYGVEVISPEERAPAFAYSRQKEITMQQTGRNIHFYKVAQFLLLMYLVAGNFFPNHYWVQAMMANTHMAAQFIVLLSGLLTHYRYRAFFANAHSGSASIAEFMCPNARVAYKLYFQQRIFVLAPFFVAALIWAIPLAIAKNMTWSVRSILSTMTFTSSLQTLWPMHNSTEPLAVVLEPVPFLLLGQTLVVCWLVYPLICQSILLARSIISLRSPTHSERWQQLLSAAAATAMPFIVAGISLLLVPNHKEWAVDLKVDNPVKDTTSLAGAATWFVNPCWKLPVFVCGVTLAEWVHDLRWDLFAAGSSYAFPEDEPTTVFTRWILPFIVDLLMPFVFFLMAYDPRKLQWKTNLIAQKLLWCIGMSAVELDTWTAKAPWILLPVVSLVLFLVASPYAHRGLTWKLLCQDPILSVLPGRTAIGLSVVTTLVIFSLPQKWRDEILGGAGLFFILFVWFTPSIVFYYYVYQPWHLWISLQPLNEKYGIVHTIELAEIQHLTSPAIEKQPLETRDMLAAEGLVSPTSSAPPQLAASTLRMLTSPHYDPFFPKNIEQELRVYRHIAAIPSPLASLRSLHLGFWRWVLVLFVETQYVE